MGRGDEVGKGGVQDGGGEPGNPLREDDLPT